MILLKNLYVGVKGYVHCLSQEHLLFISLLSICLLALISCDMGNVMWYLVQAFGLNAVISQVLIKYNEIMSVLSSVVGVTRAK